MKTNMGKVFTTLLCMMMCLSLYAQEFTLGMVVGSWNFSAPDAPYGYQKGTCQIKKTGENLSAVFTISDTEMTVKEIKKESDTYKCNFYVDGTYVSLTFIQEGKNKLTGKANAMIRVRYGLSKKTNNIIPMTVNIDKKRLSRLDSFNYFSECNRDYHTFCICFPCQFILAFLYESE